SQAIKSVEIGSGLGMGRMSGSQAMDEIFYDATRLFYRVTNHAGGVEGGITNGMPLIVRACMKPIPTQEKPLRSVDLDTKEATEAAYERSDVCAVPAAG
ncbi:MAG: chorismate synthase, partial [Thermodesulfovibrionales bacterium]